MKFIDSCKIQVIAGKGGDGLISFRREKKVPRGGPDGGDGGDGGSIYFVGNSNVNTLLNLRFLSIIKGNDGENGKSKNCSGANGQDKYFQVPLGTIVINKNTNSILVDIVDEKPYLIARGGKGGKGNVKFKSSKNLVPFLSENGLPGEILELELNLKILADVGLVGLPNAGKSSLLSVLTNAKPKIANYPFTTLSPQLGLVKVDQNNSFVLADLPGLIDQASQNKGLGFQFLKHIQRCKVIAHVIDFGNKYLDPIHAYQTIKKELTFFSDKFLQTKQIIVANKNDLDGFKLNLINFKNKYPDLKIISISSLTKNNLQNLKYELNNLLLEAKKSIDEKTSEDEIDIILEKDDLKVIKKDNNTFEVSGKNILHLVNLIPLNSFDNRLRFNQKLKNLNVFKLLKEKNVKNGDIVKIYKYELVWEDDW